MKKRKASKKRGFSFEEMPILKTRKKAKLHKHDPAAFFKNSDQVSRALAESLVDHDAIAFTQILDAYLRINR